MRLHRLELTGFGPFRARQVVDFDAFDTDGIFLISGRTGAGKSSILDGVCFALYGGVPRYGSSPLRVRSDHATDDEPTEVVLDFTTGGTRYRVARSPDYERAKRKGTGVTTVPHSARLDEEVDGVWITRAAKPRETGELLSEIIGLTREQFLQVILLAQNRFSEFLLAKNDDRQALLRTLFDTRVFADYQTAIEARRRDGLVSLARSDAGVRALLVEGERLIAEQGWEGEVDAPLPDGIPQRLLRLGAALPRAVYRVEAAAAARERAAADVREAETVLAARRGLQERQIERRGLRERLSALDARSVEIDRVRGEVAAAAAAEALRAVLDAVDRSTESAAAATARVEAAREAWGGDDDATALGEITERLGEDIGSWRAAARHETELAVREAALAELRAGITAAEAALEALDAQRRELPLRLAEIDVQMAEDSVLAAGLEAWLAASAGAREALEAARDAERLGVALRARETERVAAAGALADATTALTALLRRRLAGYAGELARDLVAGEPCAVCGSIEHPSPATSHDPITDGDVALAEEAKESAIAAERAAAHAEREVRAAHALAAERAGGESIEEHTRRLSDAEAGVARAREAAERVEAAAERRRATAESLAVAEAEAQSRTAQWTADRDRATAAAESLASLREGVAAARGDAESVAARIADAETRRARAAALLEALTSAHHRAVELADRDADLAERIGASLFDSAEAAREALRDPADVTRLSEAIAEHDGDVRATRDRLLTLELDLVDAGDEPIDLDEVVRAVEAARASAEAAADEATRIAVARERLEPLLVRAADAWRAIEAETAEHDVVVGLSEALSGRTPRRMDLETFVLAAELEEIVVAANLRLAEMSSGRYRLRHSDALAARGAASGLGLEVVDAHTGRGRPPQSLSGGESFLASLALALGLAEVVTSRAGGVRLDTLFIDEGFGSLDADTLEVAMRTLDALRQGGRTVGVISHVEAMKEQIPAQVRVAASPQGPSVIEQQSWPTG